MKVRYEATIRIINPRYFINKVGQVYHSEYGAADLHAVGSLLFYLGGELVWIEDSTPKLWEKYGDPQIRNANKA